MDIKHLLYFIEVAKEKSFSKAANNLFITQPTISKMIKNLETELGVVLFDRSKKQLTLTEAGKVMLEQAKLIEQAFHNFQVELDLLSGLKKGHIRIGLPPIFEAQNFLKIVSHFHKKYPGITFQLVEDGSKKIEESVENNLLDLGIIVLPTNEQQFNHFSFMKENLLLIVHKTHPFATKEEIELKQLKNEPFILYNKDFVLNGRIIDCCQKAGFRPTIIAQSSQRSFIEDMVTWQLGIAILPASACENLKDEVKAVHITNPTISWEVGIIWSKTQSLSYASSEFLRFAKVRLTHK